MKKYLIFISILLVSCSVKIYDVPYSPKLFDDRFVKVDNKIKIIRNIRTKSIHKRLQNQNFIRERVVLKSNNYNLISVYNNDKVNSKLKIID